MWTVAIRKSKGKRHLIIPDLQLRKGVKTSHFTDWLPRFIKQHHKSYPFDAIIQLGDAYDFPSLSSYDERGRRPSKVEGKRLKDDFEFPSAAIAEFCQAIEDIDCRKVFLEGNHENRLNRYVEEDVRLDGMFDQWGWEFEYWDWECHPFLKPVVVDGIVYAHYFPLNARGEAGGGVTAKNGCPSAEAQVKRVGRSCVAGHSQGFQYSEIGNITGRMKMGIIAGSFYQHSESYRGPMGKNEWRGVVVLNDIHGGFGDIMKISLDYLGRKYG